VAGTPYTLTHDVESRLVGVRGGAEAGFVYDGDGNRVSATFGVTTTYYVGSYFELTGSEVTRYYDAGGQRVGLRRRPAGQAGTLFYLFGDHPSTESRPVWPARRSQHTGPRWGPAP
jgi:hypothetical protein